MTPPAGQEETVVKKQKTSRIRKELRSIKAAQGKAHEPALRFRSFSRVARGIVCNELKGPQDQRFSPEGLCALQEALEEYVVTMLAGGVWCCRHRNRVVLEPKDIALYLRLTTMPKANLTEGYHI